MINFHTVLLLSGRRDSVQSEGTAAFAYQWLVSVVFQYLLPESHLFSITPITKQYLIDVCLTQSGKARYKYYD